MIDYVCIIACGKGKRLNPLTINIPKVLVNINNENMITKIVNYWKKYTNNFIVVINEEYNKLVDYYLKILGINYTIKNVYIENQENCYTIDKSLNEYMDKSILITWCDIVPTDIIDLTKIKNTNCIFINNFYNYRSRYLANSEKNTIKKVTNYNDGNIIGIYYFKKYKGIKNYKDDNDLCDCYLNNYDNFITYQLDDIIDIGDKEKLGKYVRKEIFITRYFNKISIINSNWLLKESTCNYGDNIISNEINFYQYILNNNIDYPIPIIKDIKCKSFTMEYLKNYKTLFNVLKNENKNKKMFLIKNLLIKLDRIHDKHTFSVKKEKISRRYL